MTLQVAVQMDPVASINIAGDSTFALMLEAQNREHALFYYTPETLSLLNGDLTAHLQSIRVRDVQGDHFSLEGAVRRPLRACDVVLMRQDPPFNMAYITATHLLEHLPASTLVVNDPAHVRNAPEKLLVTLFPELMPPTLISRCRADIDAFRRAYGAVVMKPLYGNGGAGVFLVQEQDVNFGSLFEMFSGMSSDPWVVQKFLPDISKGDKRIILVDGVAVAGLNRLPAPDDVRSNLARGGSGALSSLTPREEEICAIIGPELRKRGLLFTGIDVIGGFLTEINVTSPTGLRAITRLGGPDIAPMIWDSIEQTLSARRG